MFEAPRRGGHAGILLGVVRMDRRTAVSRVRGDYSQDGRVPMKAADMTEQRRRDDEVSSSQIKKEKPK